MSRLTRFSPVDSEGDIGRYGSLRAFLEAEIEAGAYLDDVHELQDQILPDGDDDPFVTRVRSTRRGLLNDADPPQGNSFIRMPRSLRLPDSPSASLEIRYYRSTRNANQTTPTRDSPSYGSLLPVVSSVTLRDVAAVGQVPNVFRTPSPQRDFAGELFENPPHTAPAGSRRGPHSLTPIAPSGSSHPEPMTPSRWNRMTRTEQDEHLNKPVTFDELRSINPRFPRRPGMRPYLPKPKFRRASRSDPMPRRNRPRRHTRRFHVYEDDAAYSLQSTRSRSDEAWDPWTAAHWHLYDDDENDNAGVVNVDGGIAQNDDPSTDGSGPQEGADGEGEGTESSNMYD